MGEYHLPPAQVHAALVYYYDHQTEIDHELDEALLAFNTKAEADYSPIATRTGRILVTEDQDFTHLHLRLAHHAGIVFFPMKLNLGDCIDNLEWLAQTTDQTEMADQFIFGRW